MPRSAGAIDFMDPAPERTTPNSPGPGACSVDDDLWALIEPLLPPWPEKAPGPQLLADRLCLQGILYVLGRREEPAPTCRPCAGQAVTNFCLDDSCRASVQVVRQNSTAVAGGAG